MHLDSSTQGCTEVNNPQLIAVRKFQHTIGKDVWSPLVSGSTVHLDLEHSNREFKFSLP